MSLEIPKLDDKTFEELFQEARALIPRYAPQWTDHNFSDPGITFIDLFAWLAEMQIYSTDRITPQLKRKFLKYLETFPKPAGTSTGHITMGLVDPEKTITVGKGALLFAADTANRLFEPFETLLPVTVSGAAMQRILYVKKGKFYEVPIETASQNGYFEPFDQSMPVGGRLLIGLENSSAVDSLNMRFDLIENDLPVCKPATKESDASPSVNIIWETWNGAAWQVLTVDDMTCGLNHGGYAIVSGLNNAAETIISQIPGFGNAPSASALTWISLRPSGADEECFEIPPRIHAVRLHAVSVQHGCTWKNEAHDGTGFPLQTITLKNRPLLAGNVLLKVDDEQWTEVRDFDASSPLDLHYTVDCANGVLQFGDGERGAIPSEGKGTIVVESYRSGGGSKGNIVAGKMVRFDDILYTNVSILGSSEASGGTEEEKIDNALDRERQERKQPTRLLTEEDIETIVRSTPGTRIHAVKVLFGYHPLYCSITMPGTVSIVVVPSTRYNHASPPACPGKGFLNRISRFLDDKRLITSDIHVIRPKYLPISVSLQLHIQARMDKEAVRASAVKALNDFINPFTGGNDGKGWKFGYSVVTSDIVALLQGIEGVTCARNIYLSSPGIEPVDDAISLPVIGLAYSSVHTITIMMD